MAFRAYPFPQAVAAFKLTIAPVVHCGRFTMASTPRVCRHSWGSSRRMCLRSGWMGRFIIRERTIKPSNHFHCKRDAPAISRREVVANLVRRVITIADRRSRTTHYGCQWGHIAPWPTLRCVSWRSVRSSRFITYSWRTPPRFEPKSSCLPSGDGVGW